jgi:hypothetical protein
MTEDNIQIIVNGASLIEFILYVSADRAQFLQ